MANQGLEFTLVLHKPHVISRILYKDEFPRQLAISIDGQEVVAPFWTDGNNGYTDIQLPQLVKGADVKFQFIGGWVNPSDVQLLENRFERVDMHVDILHRSNFVPSVEWGNTVAGGGTGLAEVSVLSGGAYGSSQLSLQSINGFGVDQLIVYQGDNNQYYTAVISSTSGSTVGLGVPLKATLSSPQKIWSFYSDPDHPNEYGYKAIADYAHRNLFNLNKGKHVFLGDSWFDSPHYLSDRLASKLPNATIINAGIGGNTAQDLLDRFDSAVASEKPDVVWVMTGTNDYQQGVTKETYIGNVQKIIRRINDSGARAIVFNSSVGKLITHDQNGQPYPVPLDTYEKISLDYFQELEKVLSH